MSDDANLVMQILHVIDSLRPRRGGPPIVAASLAAAQAALGHEVHLLSYAHEDAPEIEDAEPLAAQIPGFSAVRHLRLPLPSHAERLLSRDLRAELRKIVSRLDIAHLHRMWEPLIPAASAELRSAAVPYVLSPHGMLHPWSLAQSALKKRVALALFYRRVLGGAAALHALNEQEKLHLESLGLGPPVRIVPNGVWLSEQAEADEGFFARAHPRLGGHPYILFLGRLHHKKGPDILIDAFALLHQRLPQVRLVIAGDDSGARAEIERRIAAAGLEEHALLVGPIYGSEKRAALAEAACFCLPSRQEGFPIAVLEAMAAGLPAIISRECYMPDVEAQQAGLVVELDAPSFAGALERPLRDDALRRRMGANARELVERAYTWPKIAQQMVGVYESLLPH